MSWTKGAHQMRFGGEVRQARIDSFYTTGGRGAFFFNGTARALERSAQRPNFDTNIASLADFMAGYVYQSIIMRGDQERLSDHEQLQSVRAGFVAGDAQAELESWAAL